MNGAVGRSRQRGFSLLELALVLFVLTMLLGGLLGPIGTRVEQSERQAAEGDLESIAEALVGFTVANGRMPCPDSDGDGIEDITGSDCSVDPVGGATSVGNVLEGNLPWVTLGVGQADPWEAPYRYVVMDAYADTIDGTNTTGCDTTAGVSFELCSNFAIAGAGLDALLVDDGVGSTIADAVPALVLSFGSSNSGSGFETENTDADRVFTTRSFSRSAGNEFDDLLTWLSPHVLHNRMILSGRLP